MKYLKQTHKINSEPEIVFAAMTNPLTIEIWSGFEAKMTAEAGTEFSLWDGDIEGKNLEIVPGELIKQQWYFDGQEEQSVVTITLKPDGTEKTVAELVHENIPDEAYDDMKVGWKKYYFGALKDYFN